MWEWATPSRTFVWLVLQAKSASMPRPLAGLILVLSRTSLICFRIGAERCLRYLTQLEAMIRTQSLIRLANTLVSSLKRQQLVTLSKLLECQSTGKSLWSQAISGTYQAQRQEDCQQAAPPQCMVRVYSCRSLRGKQWITILNIQVSSVLNYSRIHSFIAHLIARLKN